LFPHTPHSSLSPLPPRPPPSTLFPYTTLFRSQYQRGLCPVCNLRITRITGWRLHYRVPRVLGGSTGIDNRVLVHPALGGRGSEEDRKSTRLNSSHVKISYAVFCLKKKKPAT